MVRAAAIDRTSDMTRRRFGAAVRGGDHRRALIVLIRLRVQAEVLAQRRERDDPALGGGFHEDELGRTVRGVALRVWLVLNAPARHLDRRSRAAFPQLTRAVGQALEDIKCL
eukprot:4955668-Prymnesium_polylepis.1